MFKKIHFIMYSHIIFNLKFTTLHTSFEFWILLIIIFSFFPSQFWLTFVSFTAFLRTQHFLFCKSLLYFLCWLFYFIFINSCLVSYLSHFFCFYFTLFLCSFWLIILYIFFATIDLGIMHPLVYFYYLVGMLKILNIYKMSN